MINAGAIADSNPANKATINNLDFILWGDNGLPLATKPGDVPDSLLSFVERKWLVTATGTTARLLPTEMRIDVNKLPAEPMSYWLVIDRSGRGNFSADNLEYILPERTSSRRSFTKMSHGIPMDPARITSDLRVRKISLLLFEH